MTRTGQYYPCPALTKEQCIHALITWYRKHPGVTIQLPPVLPEPTVDFHLLKGEFDLSKYQILDQDTISELRHDIAKTSLPSWLERPPQNFGSSAHGKLKADHWRTVCTVSMVITLVRLWGSSNASLKQKALLDNFVHLVSAVDLATRRSLDPDRIQKFDDHMQEYLLGLKRLFEWHHFVPNNHISLHLRQCLELFGPVHAWWAYPFERFNGLLQKLNTNSKADAIPLTFMRYFYIGGSLRWLISTTEWPDAAPYNDLVESFHDTFRTATRGTRLADFRPFGAGSDDVYAYDDKKSVSLPREMYDLLVKRIQQSSGSPFTSLFAKMADKRPRLSTEVQYIKSVDCDGVKYSRKGAHGRNSFIMFVKPEDRNLPFPRAGRIQEVFLHVREEGGRRVVQPFFSVEEYEPLAEGHIGWDPYRCFPDLNTRLFYANSRSTPVVLSLSDIQAHFAAFFYQPPEIGQECVVVRSLDRS
ncbi:hypothetical protein BN946_scf185010.g12 [Trametes cinnabarina]|uniref:DUF4218 domain-containing protein n=1 Tax=Pycnoporus cinnabarinus TaxID=5643 RepID=A0A060SKP2_PYCCI|nr:hypothetical protein BN946_scf185010.g12 [Trametes cinnabarina]